MKIVNATFITSAADKKGFLRTEKPIICVAGKSNVGKSSFINMLANQKKLARTSNTPGRTRLVNYFDFGEFIIADLPGYGYAKVSKSEKEKWARTLSDFFDCTKIAHAIALVDIRHDPTEEDKLMINLFYSEIIPFTLVATKADKIAKTKVKTQAGYVANKLGLAKDNVIATSAETRLGKEEVLNTIENAVRIARGVEEDEEFYSEDGEIAE